MKTPCHTGPAILQFVSTALVLVSVVLTVAACGSDPASETAKENVHVTHVEVDGKQIPCVVYAGYSGGGISCDWSTP